MAVKFNPFTGQLQIDEKGSGGGSSVIDGEVDTYNDLPLDGSAALNSSWLVRTASGSWFTGGSKPAGIYVRVNTVGSSRDNDYVYAGLLPSAFSDSELKIYDQGDSTKTAQFQLSGIAAGQNRVVSLPDKNITLDDSGDSRTPTAHAASHAAGVRASYGGQVAGMTENVFIRANTAGTAGNSITLAFDGVDDIATVLAAWNSANPSNQATLISGDGSQVPNNVEEIALSGGVAVGSDPITSNVVVAGSDSRISLTGSGANIIEFETQELSLNHTGGNDTPYISVSDGTDEALLGLRQGEMFLQGSNPVVRIEQNGGSLADIKMRSAILEDSLGANEEGPHTATFDAQENLTANRTYDLPDRSGELMLVGDAPTSHSHGNLTNDGKVGSTSGLPLVTTTAGAVTTLTLGTANQVLRVNSGATGVEFADPAASGVTGAASSASDVLGVSGANITGVDAGSADRLVFWDDSASKLTYLEAGSGLSISGTTLTATASGGSKTYAVFSAEHNQPPSTAFATLDTRNSIAVLDFDDATDESAVFVGIIPEGASLGSGLKIRLQWMATTATSGNCVWDVSLERMTTDLDSDSFDTIASATAAANGTSGILTVTEITLTTIDSVTAGDGFRLKVTRDANNASDTMSGDAELVVVEVRSAA